MRHKLTLAEVRPVTIRVDPRSKIPAYVQITRQVRALVATGALRSGDQLPTVRGMAAEAGIHFNTVARAYRILDEAGLISTQHGRGTYVVARLPSAAARKARRVALDGMVQDLMAAASRIGFTPREVRRAVERGAGRVQGKTPRPRGPE